MPAAVLVVHDEQNTRELAVSALRTAFLEAVWFADPVAALDFDRSQFSGPCPGYVCDVRARQTERRCVGAYGPNEAAAQGRMEVSLSVPLEIARLMRVATPTRDLLVSMIRLRGLLCPSA
jgi:hypothetical protein